MIAVSFKCRCQILRRVNKEQTSTSPGSPSPAPDSHYRSVSSPNTLNHANSFLTLTVILSVKQKQLKDNLICTLNPSHFYLTPHHCLTARTTHVSLCSSTVIWDDFLRSTEQDLLHF
ncbi:hypothetical protein ILYODFUR_014210 [Ilyodon furcidens]|uniref:Uncharacterized protein n=1 Tax=Ilyodon furcidens TaxID=33524 RepID=A0ABV0SZJ1_9TELE